MFKEGIVKKEVSSLVSDDFFPDALRFIFLSVLLFVSPFSFSEPLASHLNSYYKTALNKSGPALENALHDIVDNHKVIQYTRPRNTAFNGSNLDVWEALAFTDSGCGERLSPDCDSVMLLYLNEPRLVDLRNSGTSHPNSWDREHVWPTSYGFPESRKAAYTDLHHLRPADREINAAKSDLVFGVGGKPVKDTDGATLSRLTGAKTDSTNGTFEPTDVSKGQVARMIFYMAVRYGPEDIGGYEKMTLDLDVVPGKGSKSSGQIGDLCVLLNWNSAFPPSMYEKQRNDRIQLIQGNRNPFIDIPDFANAIWTDECR